MSRITTEGGSVITTEGGFALATDAAVDNSDIQYFDFSVNLMKALLWQYNEATTLQYLLQAKQDWYDANQRDFWNNWLRDVFDLRTATAFGMKVWSIILQIPLFVSQTPDITDAPFGFGPDDSNYDNSNFVPLNGATNTLPLETKRLALRLRYFQLTSSGTVPEVNRFLAYLFGDRGRVYLVDNHNMTQNYVFEFPVTSDLAYLFDNFDVLPRPAGVGSTYRDATESCFGFGPDDLNYDNGNFGA